MSSRPLLDQAPDVGELVRDQPALVEGGALLRLQPVDLRSELADLLGQDLPLPVERRGRAAKIRRCASRVRGSRRRSPPAGSSSAGKAMSSAPSRSAISRASSARSSRSWPHRHLPGRLGLGGVEPDQRLARGHPLALAHEDAGDDAALEVLDGLALAVDGDAAGRQRGARQRGHRGPGAEADQEGAPDRRPARGSAGADRETPAAVRRPRAGLGRGC